HPNALATRMLTRCQTEIACQLIRSSEPLDVLQLNQDCHRREDANARDLCEQVSSFSILFCQRESLDLMGQLLVLLGQVAIHREHCINACLERLMVPLKRLYPMQIGFTPAFS